MLLCIFSTCHQYCHWSSRITPQTIFGILLIPSFLLERCAASVVDQLVLPFWCLATWSTKTAWRCSFQGSREHIRLLDFCDSRDLEMTRISMIYVEGFPFDCIWLISSVYGCWLLVCPFLDVAPFGGDFAWRDNDAQEDSHGWDLLRGNISNGISKLKQKGWGRWGRLICLQMKVCCKMLRRDWETGRKILSWKLLFRSCATNLLCQTRFDVWTEQLAELAKRRDLSWVKVFFFGNVESNDSTCLRAQNFGQISRMLRKQIWYIQISHEPRMRSHMRKYWERSPARGSFGGRAEPSNGKVKLGYLGCVFFLHVSWSFVVLSCFVMLFKV